MLDALHGGWLDFGGLDDDDEEEERVQSGCWGLYGPSRAGLSCLGWFEEVQSCVHSRN